VRRKIVDSHSRSVARAIAGLSSAAMAGRDAELLAHCWVGSVYESVYHWLEMPPKVRPPAEVVARTVADFFTVFPKASSTTPQFSHHHDDLADCLARFH
jgi:hypothetical protein